MKYLWSCESMSRLHISLWMISNMSELLLAPLFNLLVCFLLMQSTQVLKLVKSRLLSISSFTNILILSMKICLNHQCYKIKESSLITYLLMLVLSHVCCMAGRRDQGVAIFLYGSRSLRDLDGLVLYEILG